ncbi:MAG: ZIP family metal transporter [Elusimicrobia bacterium]|nr:ZIP family metal transporter [Elusimicrobiota bacterium]
MTVSPLLALFLVLAFAASMVGGLIPTVEGVLERLGLERIMSFRSGLLVAVAVLEVLPDAWRAFPVVAAAAAAGALGLGLGLHHDHNEAHEGHELTHPHVHGGAAQLPATAAALFVHSLIDGLNLGAVAVVSGPAVLVVGAATAVHKLADGFTLTSLFHRTGRPRGLVLLLLGAVSLATPLGALLGLTGAMAFGPVLTAALLGFAGGSFLYVGGAQIVPHLLRERDWECGAAAVAGATLMAILRRYAA